MSKEMDWCPYCNGRVYFNEPDEYWMADEGEPVEGVICPHCGEKLVIFYSAFAFHLREAREEDEMKEWEFTRGFTRGESE